MLIKSRAKYLLLASTVMCLSLLSGCANLAAKQSCPPCPAGEVHTNPADDPTPAQTPNAQDISSGMSPLEYYNRNAYGFNQGFDAMLLKPTAKVYKTLLPYPAQRGVYNFFSNIGQVPTVFNDLLQGNFYYATADTWRFIINSTVGVFGLFDVASHMGLEPHTEDFGLTLAHWGYKSSTYVVLPFLGPSTFRDTFGLVGNYFMNPLTYYPRDHHVRYGLTGLNIISKRASLLGFENVMQEAALDPYSFEKNAYMQRRNYLISQNEGDTDDPHMAHDAYQP